MNEAYWVWMNPDGRGQRWCLVIDRGEGYFLPELDCGLWKEGLKNFPRRKVIPPNDVPQFNCSSCGKSLLEMGNEVPAYSGRFCEECANDRRGNSC